jgi:hypothetical protein
MRGASGPIVLSSQLRQMHDSSFGGVRLKVNTGFHGFVHRLFTPILWKA